MKSFDSHDEATSSKYNIQIDSAQGPVIGDHLSVEQHFHTHHAPSGLTLDAEQKRNRTRMLTKVHSRWITGVLDQSLHGAAMITLGLREQVHAVSNPWGLVLQAPDQPEQVLPSGTSITRLYDEAGGELLILGEPGSGKTTLLLELARDLLQRANQDEMQPLPVIFNLSSWSVKRSPLADWLVEELNSKYQVPPKLARTWVDTNQMVLLLDGLDEVVTEHRAACIEAINMYRRVHGLVPIVVCSRRADYYAQTRRIQLRSAVAVQPLTAEQIEAYLSSAGKQLETVRIALHTDPVLQELATSPLMLSVLTLTYAGKSLPAWQIAGTSITRQQVFADYIEQMLQRRSSRSRYPKEQTIHRLAWLARQLVLHSQTEFYLERMQPDWLEQNQRLRQFYRAAVRVSTSMFSLLFGGLLGLLFGELLGLLYGSPLAGLTFGLPGGSLVGLLSGLTQQIEREIKPAEVITWSWKNMWQKLAKMEFLHSALLGWLVVGLVFGLVFGLIGALGNNLVGGLVIGGVVFGLAGGLVIGLVSRTVSELLHDTQEKQLSALSSQEKRYSAENRVLVGLISGLSVGLLSGLLFGLIVGLLSGLTVGLIFGLISGLVIGLIGGLIIGLFHRVNKEVKPVEILSWLRAAIWRGFVKGESFKQMLVVMLSIILAIMLSRVVFGGQVPIILALAVGLLLGPISGLAFELISGLVGGLSSDLLDKQILSSPNQGIRHSARNSVLVGLTSGLVVGLVSGLIAGPSVALAAKQALDLHSMLAIGLASGLLFGLPTALSIGLSNGGTACIQHVVLRMFLWSAGSAPWRYSRFLDYAAEHILLRKVGGGYIFVHRLLLEHFAFLYATPTLTQPAGEAVQTEVCTCGFPYPPKALFCPHCGKRKGETHTIQTQDISSRPTGPL